MLGLSCGMRHLVPQPGIKPRPPALGAWSLNHWTTREFSQLSLSKVIQKGKKKPIPKLKQKRRFTSKEGHAERGQHIKEEKDPYISRLPVAQDTETLKAGHVPSEECIQEE